MNLDHIDRLLVDALPWLAMAVFLPLLILAAVFATEAHRLGEDTQHDIDDYWPVPADAFGERRRLRPVAEPSETPIHDGLAGLVMSDATARAVAREWLRDIAAVEQAKAGIRPAYDHWVHWDGSCEMDCPGCARDMVGAFPVVRAA